MFELFVSNRFVVCFSGVTDPVIEVESCSVVSIYDDIDSVRTGQWFTASTSGSSDFNAIGDSYM